MDMQVKCRSTSVKSICIPNDQICADVGVSSTNDCRLKEMGSSVYEHAIKVRKPYTITKQRERWTEEEHVRFLEALKLYGRAWRQIEEHIGTKTAVQIRSHAQKFFSKAARESTDDIPGSVKAIEIPPPRPKRKPMHPYPRKLGHSSSMKMPVVEQPEWPSLPTPSTSEQENRSPTSVLSAFRSDPMGSSVSNLQSGCTSPVSSVAGSNHVGMFLCDGENRCQLPITSSEEENRSPSRGPASTGLATQEKSAMELDMDAEDHVPLEEDPSLEEAQATSLKLFGRTVLVTGFQKPSSSSDESSVQCHTTDIQSQDRSMDMDLQTQAQSIPQSPGGDFSGAPGKSAWGPWPGALPPTFFCLPSNGDPVNAAAGATTVVPVPWWWSFCRSSPFQFTNVQNTSSNRDPCQSSVEAADDEDIQQEVSWSCSVTASAGDVVNSQGVGRTREPAPSSSLRPSANSAFSSLNATSSKPARGFVPYRRCVAEKAVQDSLTTEEDGYSQGIKLCL